MSIVKWWGNLDALLGIPAIDRSLDVCPDRLPAVCDPATRFSERQGRWQLHWRLGWSFVCTRHCCLLAHVCPSCARRPRRTPPRLCATPSTPPHTSNHHPHSQPGLTYLLTIQQMSEPSTCLASPCRTTQMDPNDDRKRAQQLTVYGYPTAGAFTLSFNGREAGYYQRPPDRQRDR
jgi:hypothetical protein